MSGGALELLALIIFAGLFTWLIWLTRRIKENAELRRRYPDERQFRIMGMVWMGLFWWGLALGVWYIIYLARHAP